VAGGLILAHQSAGPQWLANTSIPVSAGTGHPPRFFDSAPTIFPLTLLTSNPVISAKTGFISDKSVRYSLIPVIVPA
jgi:hypothetical protein